MKRFSCIEFVLRYLLPGLIMLSVSCSSSPEFEDSRRIFDYVPPELPEPTPDPTPVPSPEEEPEVQESGAEENSRAGFFSRIFGRSEPGSSEATIERIGDRENEIPGDNQPVDTTGPSENVYRIKAGDALFITLTGSGGLSEQIETVVDDEGAIKLRYIGAVQAVGRTTTQLEREIELEYTERQQIYRRITARAVVPNTFYFIGGEVRQPGRFPIIGRVTLSQAVVAAGNFTEWANERKIFLVRNNERVELDFRNITRNPLQDVELLAGDVITVTRSTF